MDKQQAFVEAVGKMSEQELRDYVVREAVAAEKRKAARKAYMLRNKAARKAYSKRRNAKRNALLARAKQLGLDRLTPEEVAERLLDEASASSASRASDPRDPAGVDEA